MDRMKLLDIVNLMADLLNDATDALDKARSAVNWAFDELAEIRRALQDIEAER